MDTARVFCEKPIEDVAMVAFIANPAHMSCLSPGFEHVSLEEGAICLHMWVSWLKSKNLKKLKKRNLTSYFTRDEAQEYCQTMDENSYIWLPYDDEEEKTIISIFEEKVSFIVI